MKTILYVGLFMLAGLIYFGVDKYYLRPYLAARSMQSSIPDCLFATSVGSRGIGTVQFSPDGKVLAISGSGRRAIIDAKSGDLIGNFAKLKEKITGLQFSPDSSMIVYGDTSTIRIKNSRGENVSEIDISKDGKLGTLGKIAFDTQRDAIVFTGKGGICIYETSGKRLKSLSNQYALQALAVVDNSIIAADFKGRILKWDDAMSDQKSEIQAHKKYLSKAKLSPQGDLFFTLGRDHEKVDGDFSLKIWSTDDLSLIHSIPIGAKVTDFSADADSEHLLVSKSSGEAFVFSLKTFELQKFWLMPRGISTSDISPDALSVCFGLSKHVSTIDTDTHHDFVTGQFRTRRNGKPIPYRTIKGQSVSPGAVVVLKSRLDEADSTASDSDSSDSDLGD